MNSVNFYRSYHLDEKYEHIREQVFKILDKYLDYPDLYEFNEKDRTLTFKSERLIPTRYTNRPRVMLLFSNPHPHSVHQGMLLSPNTRGRENAFWETMRNAGWINFKEEAEDPLEIANLCFNVEYDGPFDLVFYPYYTFPTNYPNEIKKIFGKEYFNRVILKDAREEFEKVIREIKVDAVVTFNKAIFNIVSKKQIDKYIDRLINGELIEGRLKDVKEDVPIFLTYPTGWRYHKDMKILRKRSLESIKEKITKHESQI